MLTKNKKSSNNSLTLIHRLRIDSYRYYEYSYNDLHLKLPIRVKNKT